MRKGYASVLVEEIERQNCQWCAFDGKTRKATHTVKVTHNFLWIGAIARTAACKKHADEIEQEFACQIEKGKL